MCRMCSIGIFFFSSTQTFKKITQDFTLDMFTVSTVGDNDIYIKNFVTENCLKIMTDIGKHEPLTDGLVHFNQLKFCMNTRTIHKHDGSPVCMWKGCWHFRGMSHNTRRRLLWDLVQQQHRFKGEFHSTCSTSMGTRPCWRQPPATSISACAVRVPIQQQTPPLCFTRFLFIKVLARHPGSRLFQFGWSAENNQTKKTKFKRTRSEVKWSS